VELKVDRTTESWLIRHRGAEEWEKTWFELIVNVKPEVEETLRLMHLPPSNRLQLYSRYFPGTAVAISKLLYVESCMPVRHLSTLDGAKRTAGGNVIDFSLKKV